MPYVKVENGSVAEFPYSVTKLRAANPNTSFPKDITESVLNEFGVFIVNVPEMPSHTARTQKAYLEDTVSLVDGVWTQNWVVESKTSAEVQEFDDMFNEHNRAKRDTLLSATDWWSLSDTPTMTAEQTAYRQALRDITAHANWPHLNDDDWPTKP